MSLLALAVALILAVAPAIDAVPRFAWFTLGLLAGAGLALILW